MTRYIVRRLLLAVVVVFGVTLITFVLARVVPQNVAQVWAGFQGFRAGDDAIRAVEEQYHLNEPLHVQYGFYLRDLVTLNWGTSPITGRPVADDIRTFLPNPIELSAAAMAIAMVIAIPLGIVSATHRNGMVTTSPGCWRCSGFRRRLLGGDGPAAHRLLPARLG